jgi:hypothetical protein
MSDAVARGSPAGKRFPQWCSDRDAIAILQDLVDKKELWQ